VLQRRIQLNLLPQHKNSRNSLPLFPPEHFGGKGTKNCNQEWSNQPTNQPTNPPIQQSGCIHPHTSTSRHFASSISGISCRTAVVICSGSTSNCTQNDIFTPESPHHRSLLPYMETRRRRVVSTIASMSGSLGFKPGHGQCLKLGCDYFLLHPFQLTIHSSP
jgi:hypothetical protein